MLSRLASRRWQARAFALAATLAQRRLRRNRHRVRHRGAAVHDAAVRHHVGVPLLSSPTSPSRTRSGRRRAPSARARCSSRRAPTPAPSPPADRKTAFKKALCAKAPTFLDCSSKVVVIVQSNASFGGIVEPSCASNGIIDQPGDRRLRYRRRQRGRPGHGLLPLGLRRQAAVLQDRQPERRLGADAGFGGLPHRALPMSRASRRPDPCRELPCRSADLARAASRRLARRWQRRHARASPPSSSR